MSICIIIPTYGRAERLPAVAHDARAATSVPHSVLFVVEPGDRASQDECERWGLNWVLNQRTASYAGAINTAYDRSHDPWLFTGADDLHFHPGWAETALAAAEATGAAVIGTNDLFNPDVLAGTHSTHSLVARSYLDHVGGVVDEGPGSFLCEQYRHNYTDTEFIDTARRRGVFTPCLDAVVEHLHPNRGCNPKDATYRRTQKHLERDARLYKRRRMLWA